MQPSSSSTAEDLQTISWLLAGWACWSGDRKVEIGRRAPVFQHRVTTVPAVAGSCSSSPSSWGTPSPASSSPSEVHPQGHQCGCQSTPFLHFICFEDSSQAHGNSKDGHFHTAEHCQDGMLPFTSESSLTKASQGCPMKEMHASLCAKISQQPIPPHPKAWWQRLADSVNMGKHNVRKHEQLV